MIGLPPARYLLPTRKVAGMALLQPPWPQHEHRSDNLHFRFAGRLSWSPTAGGLIRFGLGTIASI